jgi:hypothetical protein
MSTIPSAIPSRAQYRDTYFPPTKVPGQVPVEGIHFTEETLAYMTSASKAQHLAITVADIFKATHVIDASAGIGGNTLGFALNPKIKHVISYEAVRDRWNMLNNNVGLYNITDKVSAYNHSFDIGEDLQLLDITDSNINGKTVVYFDPPWLHPNASIDKRNYIMAGMELSGKSLEYWCKYLTGRGYLGVIMHVPPGYNLILPGKIIDDVSDKKSRLIYYTLNSEVSANLIRQPGITQSDVPIKAFDIDVKEEEVPSSEKEIGDIPSAAVVKGPKVILQTYLTSDFPRRRYMKENFNPKAIHLGQRKLLISEIEFLTRIIKNTRPVDGSGTEGPINYTLLYVGAAPGQHIPILSDMFPEIKFVLYDPAPFLIKPSKNIEIHQELFTDDLVEKYATKPDARKESRLLFISDIRSVPRSGYQDVDSTDPEFEDEVRKNLSQQRKWVEALQPVRSLLKFRLPFTTEDEKASSEYFDGIINFQAYSPPQSAETRLEVGNKPKMIQYDHSRYEQQMFYFNTRYRIQGFQHYNRRYGWSYDTIREFFVLKKYITLRGEGDKNIPVYFAKFDELTDKPEKKISRILEKY